MLITGSTLGQTLTTTRAQRATLTIRNDVLTMMEIASSFEAASSHSYLYRDGFYRPGMLMQPISESQMSDAAASGNALGLNKELAPLLREWPCLPIEIRC